MLLHTSEWRFDVVVKNFCNKRKMPWKRRCFNGIFGAPVGIRTLDLLIRSQTLYPAELRAHIAFATLL